MSQAFNVIVVGKNGEGNIIKDSFLVSGDKKELSMDLALFSFEMKFPEVIEIVDIFVE